MMGVGVLGWLVLMMCSALATAGLRHHALRHGLLDVPNARSSHQRPTPRGGGMAIVVTAVAAWTALVGSGGLAPSVYAALLGASLAVAGIGWLDDRGHVSVRTRLGVHGLAAIWALFWLGGLPPVFPWLNGLHLEVFGLGLGGLYLVWLLNLYNFMDGIDGLAGIQALTVCLSAALLGVLAVGMEAAWGPLLLAAAVAGFLPWNFPQARIFMGDAGSGFLGVALGVLSLYSGWLDPALFWAWLILLGVFVVDATLTLLRRLLRGEPVQQAHRRHAYQRAARRLGSHRPVTLAVAAINLFWLTPWAAAVSLGAIPPTAGLALAYAPLITLAFLLGAGRPGDS